MEIVVDYCVTKSGISELPCYVSYSVINVFANNLNTDSNDLTKKIFIYGFLFDDQLHFIKSVNHQYLILCDYSGNVTSRIKLFSRGSFYDVYLPNFRIVCVTFENARHDFTNGMRGISNEYKYTKVMEGDVLVNIMCGIYRLNNNVIYNTSQMQRQSMDDLTPYFCIHKSCNLLQKTTYAENLLTYQNIPLNYVGTYPIIFSQYMDDLARLKFEVKEFGFPIATKIKNQIAQNNLLEKNVVDYLHSENLVRDKNCESFVHINFTAIVLNPVLVHKWTIPTPHYVYNVNNTVYNNLIELMILTDTKLLSDLYFRLTTQDLKQMYQLAESMRNKNILPFIESLIEFKDVDSLH